MSATRFYALVTAFPLLLGACSHSPEPPAAAQTRPGVRVAIIAPQSGVVSRDLSLTATIEAYEQVPLYAKVSGYVKSLPVDIGDRVSKGEVLATLEVPEVQQQYVQANGTFAESRAQLRKAEAEADLANKIFTRSKGLRAKDAITQEEMDEAAAQYDTAKAGVGLARAREQSAEGRVKEFKALLAYAEITAPFEGIVTRRFVDPGSLMQAATSNNNITPIIVVARTDLMRAFIDVPEPSTPYVHRGKPATLSVAAIPGEKFTARVTRYADALDTATRTMRTEADLPNVGSSLRPGMYGTLMITLETRADVLSLPRSVVHQDDRGAFVYAVQDGKAVERRVRLGLESDQRVEVVDGVDDNARVISTTQDITEGTRVTISTLADRRDFAGAK